MQNKKTLVLGASETEWRYSHKAVHALLNHQIPVVAVGKRQGKIKSVSIERDFPAFDENIHTVTMYLNVQNQEQYRSDILKLKPQRVIFNPGSENADFARELKNANLEVVNACTLVMLSVGNY